MTAGRGMAEGVIAARQVDHDLCPVRVQFLGEDLGETVVGPLPHLRLRPGDVHHAVRCDRQEHAEAGTDRGIGDAARCQHLGVSST